MLNIRLFFAFALFAILPNTHGQSYEKVFDFGQARAADKVNQGAHPSAPLIQSTDGNYYGTTFNGGSNDHGTVFSMTPTGVVTTLAEFTGLEPGNPGSGPNGLVEGSDGNFYGTTFAGGTNGQGTVFRMTPNGDLTTLVNFIENGPTNKGRSPSAALIEGIDGNFYGTTREGGANGYGTVFRMTPGGLLTTLVEFTYQGASNKGASPQAQLVRGSDGNFYGTTAFFDGVVNHGTVFKMTPAGVLTTLVQFTDADALTKGIYPTAAVVLGSDGNFYGTTQDGGANGFGTAFRMTPTGVLTTLLHFTGDGPSNKGDGPLAALVQGNDGRLYGTTSAGGANNRGTVFSMTLAGTLTTLVELTGTDAPRKGSSPMGLVQGSDGNFYGTTYSGGLAAGSLMEGHGTIFKMTPTGGLTTLVEFTGDGASDIGANPSAALVQDGDGNFYGTTTKGGNDGGSGGFGTVFKLAPDGVLTTLVAFTGNSGAAKGTGPSAPLVQGADGNYYGTTSGGGASGLGTVFRMTTAGVLTTLVEFTANGASNKGSRPQAALLEGSDGNFCYAPG